MWKKLRMCWGKVLNRNNHLAVGGKVYGRKFHCHYWSEDGL